MKVQILMKSSGGLICGRSTCDSVFMKWTQNMSAVNKVCQSLEDFFGMVFSEHCIVKKE